MRIEDGILNDVSDKEIVNGTFKIPKEVRILGDWAFCQCASLEKIDIPEGITAIGRRAFRFCFLLQKVSIPDSVHEKMIADGAFAFCPSLEKVEVSPSRELSIAFKSKFPEHVRFVRVKSKI